MEEEIYVNAEYLNSDNPIPSTINPKGPRSSKRSFYSGVILSLGLLSVLLMVGLITLGVHLRDSAVDLSATSSKLLSMTEENNYLKANLSTKSSKLSSMTEERDLLRANLTEKTNELERLQSLSKQKKMCPTGWTKFSSSCYLLSQSSGSWDEGRKDCRDKGADLVVIESAEEQTFVSTITSEQTWIGFSDKEQEGAWKWVDGTPVTWTNWDKGEPNNTGEEDCAYMYARSNKEGTWNDLRCTKSMKWICEKIPQHNE